MKLYLVRHGQTDWNAQGRIQGQLDIPLNEEGKSQAKIAAEKLKNHKISSIISTDLQRGLETAQIINRYHNLEIKTDPRLREKYYAMWEGITWNEVHAQNPQLTQEILDSPLKWHAPEDGETMEEMFTRIKSFLVDLKNHNSHTSGNDHNLLIVSHNSPIRIMIAIAKKIAPEDYRKVGHIKNSELHIIEIRDDDFVFSHNPL